MYGEERDLSLRLLAEGFMTRMGRADPPFTLLRTLDP